MLDTQLVMRLLARYKPPLDSGCLVPNRYEGLQTLDFIFAKYSFCVETKSLSIQTRKTSRVVSEAWHTFRGQAADGRQTDQIKQSHLTF